MIRPIGQTPNSSTISPSLIKLSVKIVKPARSDLKGEVTIATIVAVIRLMFPKIKPRSETDPSKLTSNNNKTITKAIKRRMSKNSLTPFRT